MTHHGRPYTILSLHPSLGLCALLTGIERSAAQRGAPPPPAGSTCPQPASGWSRSRERGPLEPPRHCRPRRQPGEVVARSVRCSSVQCGKWCEWCGVAKRCPPPLTLLMITMSGTETWACIWAALRSLTVCTRTGCWLFRHSSLSLSTTSSTALAEGKEGR